MADTEIPNTNGAAVEEPGTNEEVPDGNSLSSAAVNGAEPAASTTTENTENTENTNQVQSKDDDDDKQEPEQLRKLFIGGLTYTTTEEDLRNHFGKYGEIVDAVVMQDPATKKSRCFGFITYKKSSMVDEAQKNRPHVIHERTVEPKRAIPREMSSKPGTQATVCKAFVGGIKEGLDEADLREYFSKFGNLTSVDIITEKGTTKKRGFAFVTYEDYDAVDKLVLMRNHNVKGFRLEVQKAVSKEEMRNAEGGRDRGGGDYPPPRGGDRYGGGGRGGSGGYDRDRHYRPPMGRGGPPMRSGGRGDDRYGEGRGAGGDDRYASYGSRGVGPDRSGYGGGGPAGGYGSGGGAYGSRAPSGGSGWGAEGGGSTYGSYGAGSGAGGYAPQPSSMGGYGGSPGGGGSGYGSSYGSYGSQQPDYGRYGSTGQPPSSQYGGGGSYGTAPDYGGGGAGGPMRSGGYSAGAPAVRSAPYDSRGGRGGGGGFRR